MKKFVTVAVLVLVSLTFAAQVPSQQVSPDAPGDKLSEPKASDANLGREVVETLEAAYASYWTAFISGEATFADVLRIDRKLFEAQKKFGDPDSIKEFAQSHFDRAERLETTAAQFLRNGIGTKQILLEARAARLNAALELAQH
ncbi:hypothetical protein [Rhodopirellula bahusiensis]|nr:hypothetical protein [Rhodopirellula bahusiensis]